ncbi:SGNH/GDSL hydrolase family protein [Microbacterium sp. NFH-22A-Y]|uniref:SGNH/GDSL hydrolase family protein n=1 Tax=Microbacterium sp. NFH-22A-Y TaxID=2744448 RepID=UPI001F42D87E|nr:SGNH/GDSL hydrolase family protein [Microbacterium sp. NFH-22A-Y]
MGKSKRRSRRRSSDRAGWIVLGLVGLVAVVGGLTVAALTVNRAPSTVADVTKPSPAASATSTPAPAQRVAFLGDSWAGGTGADPSGPRNGYPGLTGSALGWEWKAFQGGGTGYTQGNDKGEGPFQSRVDAVVQYAPTVVVVQGSSNDLTSDFATVNAAASEVFASLRAQLPNARIYALGAINSPASPASQMDMVRSAVSAAASANGVTWIDGNAEGWLDVATDFADGFHPNNQGHAKVAQHLAAVLGG